MASDKTTIQRAFNTHFIEFLNDIVSIYPDNLEIVSARDSFETIKKMNPTAIIKAWYIHAYLPYAEVIDKGDLSYFFEKDYSSDLKTVQNTDEILKIIDRVREPLRGMSDKNKEHTTDYLKNLNKLSAVYAQL